MQSLVLEGCVESLVSAVTATQGGCTRLELCQNLIIGGTQPSFSLFNDVKEHCQIPVRVLMRPRFGDFLYDTDENTRLLKDIKTFVDLGAEGVVVGHLLADGRLDIETLKHMREAAGTAGFTLNRAFDLTRDPFEALEDAINIGFDTILTSGQASSALEGRELLVRLADQAAGRIQILAAGGINADVIRILATHTKLRAFHLSATKTADSPMLFRHPHVHMGAAGISEYERKVADLETFKAAAAALAEIKRG